MDVFKILRFEERLHGHLIEELTEMLHSAYRPLAERGMRYMATHQAPDVTLRRLKKGDSFLGFMGAELVATITLITNESGPTCQWYLRPGVFYFSQFAVKPSYQGAGHGGRLMDFIENHAAMCGGQELALDTSEQADQLIRMYNGRGYRFVEYADWKETNYRSVIMSKPLKDHRAQVSKMRSV